MDELVSIATEIRDLLVELNNKIDALTGDGTNDLSDVVSAVEGLKGGKGYDLSDVCAKLDELDSSLTSISFSVSG